MQKLILSITIVFVFTFFGSCSKMITSTSKSESACDCMTINTLIKKCVVKNSDEHLRAEGQCFKLNKPFKFTVVNPKTFDVDTINITFIKIDNWLIFDSVQNKTIKQFYTKSDSADCYNILLSK